MGFKNTGRPRLLKEQYRINCNVNLEDIEKFETMHVELSPIIRGLFHGWIDSNYKNNGHSVEEQEIIENFEKHKEEFENMVLRKKEREEKEATDKLAAEAKKIDDRENAEEASRLMASQIEMLRRKRR